MGTVGPKMSHSLRMPNILLQILSSVLWWFGVRVHAKNKGLLLWGVAKNNTSHFRLLRDRVCFLSSLLI